MAVAIAAGIATPAAAHEDPAGCTTSGLNRSFDASSGLGIIRRNGDHLDIAVRIRNDAANACSVTDATVTVRLPQPDGTPGPPITIAEDQSFPGGMPLTTLPTTVPHDVNFDASTFSGFVTIAVSGTQHFPAGDFTGSIGSTSTPLVTSKPHATVELEPDPPNGPAPLGVTYTYSVTNDSGVNPTANQGPTPTLVSPTNDNAILTDDTCSPLTFTGGDTSPSSPPLLHHGETWEFTCTRMFDAPGVFTSHVAVVGNSTRDGRPWPEATAETAVTVLAPDLTVAKAHAGDFTAGEQGRVYTLTASNAGTQATTGTVTLQDTPPAGLTATAIAGTGWDCDLQTLTCTRGDALAAGASYPAVAVTVDVANDAPSQVTNVATVSGGGDAVGDNNSVGDPTTIGRPPVSGGQDGGTSGQAGGPAGQAGGSAGPGGAVGGPGTLDVAPPRGTVRIASTRRNRDGSVSLRIRISGPGRIVVDDAPARAAGSATRRRTPNHVGRVRRTVRRAGTATLRLRPTRAARVRLRRRGLRVRVRVTYTPVAGRATSRTLRVAFRRRG